MEMMQFKKKLDIGIITKYKIIEAFQIKITTSLFLLYR